MSDTDSNANTDGCIVDINVATFKRELESSELTEAERTKKLASFYDLDTPGKRCDALRQLRGGSITGKSATKLGIVPDTR